MAVKKAAAKAPAKKAARKKIIRKKPMKTVHEFLEALDSDENLRRKVARRNPIVAFAKAHGFKFSSDELNNALLEKWGPPKHREDHPHAFTCCFSEPPGR